MSLKKGEIEKFKEKLLILRKELLHTLEGTTKEVKEAESSKGYSQHQADEGTDDFVKSVNLEVTNKEYSILRQIDRALEKIEEGTYGICDESGKEIPRARLEAIPYAVFTIEAQQKMEKRR